MSIDDLKIQDNNDRKSSLRQNTSYSVLATHEVKPEYMLHEKFDNFIQNSFASQDGIIEKFYRFALNKDEDFKQRIIKNNEDNLEAINSLFLLTKPRNIKQFSFTLSLLESINNFIKGENSSFAYAINKLLDDDINYESLKSFITKNEVVEDENFAKYIYKFFLGFNSSLNESDYYLEEENENFININNTTFLLTLLNLVNAFYSKGLIHTRNHSLKKFFDTQQNSVLLNSVAKTFLRNRENSNIVFNYNFLLEQKVQSELINKYSLDIESGNFNYTNSESLNYKNFYKVKVNNFNVYENIGDSKKTGIFDNFLEDNETTVASSRCKDLISLDLALENFTDPYKDFIKPFISANINGSISSEYVNNSSIGSSIRRSITKTGYNLSNKYLYTSLDTNSDVSSFIENLKYNISQAKTVYFDLIRNKTSNDLITTFYDKSIKSINAYKKSDTDNIGISFQNNESFIRRNESNKIGDLFTKDNIDFFESNNKISSIRKGFDSLNLNNEDLLDQVIQSHQAEIENFNSFVDAVYENKSTSSVNFYKKLLEKSVEGIRESLNRIQTSTVDNPVEYYPAHLLEEISYLIRFNSNKNSDYFELTKNKGAFVEYLVSFLYNSAKGSQDIDVIDSFFTNVSRQANDDAAVQYVKTSGNNTGYIKNDLLTERVERAFNNLNVDRTYFITNFCAGNKEVDFSKEAININKNYTYLENNNEVINTPRYYQSLGHIFSTYYSSEKQTKSAAGTGNNSIFNSINGMFYIPFYGFVKGKESKDKFKIAAAPFNTIKLENNNIFSQLKSDGQNNGIFRSFVVLLQEFLENISEEDNNLNSQMKFFVYNLFSSYSQLVIAQLSHLFEYATLLHIPKMVSEGPVNYKFSLSGQNSRGDLKRYQQFRTKHDGIKSREAGAEILPQPGGEDVIIDEVKNENYVYPAVNANNRSMIYLNVLEDFQPTHENIFDYINASGLDTFLNNNESFLEKLEEFNQKYSSLKDNNAGDLNQGLFCKRVNTNNNTKEGDAGGLDSEDLNGNEWLDIIFEEAKTYRLFRARKKAIWGASYYPYNYPLLNKHNHILSMYNGLVAFSIEKLIQQIDEDYLFVKTADFEKDMIYGPLSKVHNAFLSEDLTFAFLLDSVRFSFNHFKNYKEFLLENTEDPERITLAKELITNYVSRYYDIPEDFNIEDYLTSITQSQKLSIINKFREDNQERLRFYESLVQNRRVKINNQNLINNYKSFKQRVIRGDFDKILLIGLDNNLLDLSDSQIRVTVSLKDYVYKKKNTNKLIYTFDINQFGRNIINNSESFLEALEDSPGVNPDNVLSEICKNYLTVIAGQTLTDSSLFLNNDVISFLNAESPHYMQETNDFLEDNLPLINSFYSSLNDLKDDITSQEGEFFNLLDNFEYSNETDLYLYESAAKSKIKKDLVKRLALFDYLILSNEVIGRRCLPRQFPRILYLPINTKNFYEDENDASLRLKNLSDISVEIDPV